MTEMIERVTEAIDAVQLFSRFNDWTSDHVPGWPIEICRYGAEDEEEVVILGRFHASYGEDRALREMVGGARARAAIEAMRTPTEEMRGALMELWASDDKEKQALHYGVAWTAHIAMIDAALRGDGAS